MRLPRTKSFKDYKDQHDRFLDQSDFQPSHPHSQLFPKPPVRNYPNATQQSPVTSIMRPIFFPRAFTISSSIPRVFTPLMAKTLQRNHQIFTIQPPNMRTRHAAISQPQQRSPNWLGMRLLQESQAVGPGGFLNAAMVVNMARNERNAENMKIFGARLDGWRLRFRRAEGRKLMMDADNRV
ncbi:hypothetical protein BT63DRAFT_424835 [Microthyrium microscopicum]|uniref:Uncharacterized protein n=1 Tax=Microthyrium microscopicum TaxID=703497 RepID=A0A6A6UA41_9PEZI|nr:hypothetical protein BT63DRAFT_424835 [Microthyrium microscopicum]